MLRNLSIGELEDYVKNEMYYEDSCALKEEIQNGMFMKRVLGAGENVEADEETNLFSGHWLSQISEKLLDCLDDLDERKIALQ